MAIEADTYKYWAPVDRNAPNNSHSFALQLIGYDKHVLELGCAAGHVTRALVDQGCTVVGVEYEETAAALAREIAEEVLIVDLFQAENLTKALDGRTFDVVYAGDVLEHLPDPAGVLTAARRALRPGGTVVVSLPNIAHVDVKLALMSGEFRYRENGLLDGTHLRFFTRDSILALIDEAGLELAELRRVVRPVFETEIGIQPASVDAIVLRQALADPEALTYQFVFKALPGDGIGELQLAAQRYREIDEELAAERLERMRLEAEIVELRSEVEALQMHLAHASAAQTELAAVRLTKTFRATAGLRKIYSRLRGA
jgi:2-polyprenyl-3-methyl-5-hydroxy-6-metoxy-1,4-benzoquinol methylase